MFSLAHARHQFPTHKNTHAERLKGCQASLQLGLRPHWFDQLPARGSSMLQRHSTKSNKLMIMF